MTRYIPVLTIYSSLKNSSCQREVGEDVEIMCYNYLLIILYFYDEEEVDDNFVMKGNREFWIKR